MLQTEDTNRQALELLSNIYLQTNRSDRARQCLLALVAAHPAEPMYCDRLANLLVEQRQIAEAAECYRRLIDIQPRLADSRYNYARLLNGAGKPEAALEQYQVCLDLGISHPEEVYSNISVILSDQHRHREAEQALEAALTANTDFIPALYNLGVVREERGQWDSASELFWKILALEPDHCDALTHLAHGQTISDPDNALIGMLLEALTRSDTDTLTREALRFALGKIYDDCKLYEEAFGQYQQGNEYSHQRTGTYDRARQEALVSKLIEFTSGPWLAEVEPLWDHAPVFICGMFRSGTTLLEQMLTSHPQLTAGGELNFFNQQMPLPGTLDTLDQARLHNIGKGYIDFLTQSFPDAVRVINKRPDNFVNMSLIQALFPRGRFINTSRHPLDNCLSIYFQQFAGSVKYHTRLLDVGHYYLQYRALMDCWKQRFPDNIHNVDYQSLVSQPQQELEPLLSFLALDWHQGCLDFHKSGNRVRTASVWQVRQPLYQRSRGRWHNYESHLEPLKEYLQDAGLEL